ncbi:DnaJ domain-containing protein [Cellvibrio mixtus]|uniref:DnaJ domain-containing protein n=1 Tax=Cellvibrio mixtus TaxID=39650 RepID=UPI000586D108|nr:DnaJ domain-containing protein [Cellvibrio mixtus]
MSNQIQTLRESFFNTVFSLLGHIANCDGYINRNEIKRIEVYMEKMDLSEKCKREAQHLFKEGTSPAFNISAVLKEFSKKTTPNLTQILLVYLITMARTDGVLVDKEMQVVHKVAKELGYTSIVFDHLLKMISAQDEFASAAQKRANQQSEFTQSASYQSKASAYRNYEAPKHETSGNGKPGSDASGSGAAKDGSKNEQAKSSNNTHKNNFYSQAKYRNPALEDAYQALGVNSSMTEQEIRRAYQKLVSQFHPDKLTGQGMPPDFINAATERFKKIQAAYEFLKKYRSIYSAA